MLSVSPPMGSKARPALNPSCRRRHKSFPFHKTHELGPSGLSDLAPGHDSASFPSQTQTYPI